VAPPTHFTSVAPVAENTTRETDENDTAEPDAAVYPGEASVIVTADVPHVPETTATLPDVYSFEVWSATTFVEDTPVADAVSVN
jgi:hypothetical protein